MPVAAERRDADFWPMITIFERMNLRDHFEEGAKLADTVLRDDAFLAAMAATCTVSVGFVGPQGHRKRVSGLHNRRNQLSDPERSFVEMRLDKKTSCA